MLSSVLYRLQKFGETNGPRLANSKIYSRYILLTLTDTQYYGNHCSIIGEAAKQVHFVSPIWLIVEKKLIQPEF